ncbi:putative membrane protein [Virgibacillus halotolerans]|uniref:hypothetical protein n=1 Tax=Virgibacillus halotolerans TaxID=1071053 RepID=UPI001961ABC6|nr:hypothetical protein [Virgibacillus halotolerans]MBM7600920.1 putative membrane protein [Virgibacillus halotolerans]
MIKNNKSELAFINEFFLSFLVIACLGVFCYKAFEVYPWLSFIGVPIGLGIIIACWKRKTKWSAFLIGLFSCTLFLTMFFGLIIE